MSPFWADGGDASIVAATFSRERSWAEAVRRESLASPISISSLRSLRSSSSKVPSAIFGSNFSNSKACAVNWTLSSLIIASFSLMVSSESSSCRSKSSALSRAVASSWLKVSCHSSNFYSSFYYKLSCTVILVSRSMHLWLSTTFSALVSCNSLLASVSYDVRSAFVSSWITSSPDFSWFVSSISTESYLCFSSASFINCCLNCSSWRRTSIWRSI